MNLVTAFLAGLLFGAGLILSGMSNPAKVLAFLDVGGTWDPSLLFVMLGVGVSIGILIWLRRHPRDQHLVAVALTLIMGGALGNVIDRVTRGHVVDFVDFYVGSWHFAAFNVADMAISCGAGLLILDMLLDSYRRKATKVTG